jgi:RNA polymerase sigma factor (sigma-70 family)
VDPHSDACTEVLQRYLETSADEEAEEALSTLILEHALPVLRKVVRARLSLSESDAIEDVCGDAAVRLITRLRGMRESAVRTPIDDFRAYAAAVAGNAAAQYRSDRAPGRARLRRRIRLLCSSDRRFFTEERQGRWICGLRRDFDAAPADSAALETCRAELAATRLPADFTEFAMRFFQALGSPAELSEATGMFVRLLGIGGETVNLDELGYELPAAARPQSEPAPAWAHELWREIRTLPAHQRAALLLNLRLPGGSAIGVFEELGIASFGDLAEAIGISEAELAGLWARLPLDDREIGERLGVERQRVINLRGAARERLKRRRSAANILTKGQTN